MAPKEDLLLKLRDLKKKLSKKYPIASMALFGSYSRNEQFSHSDIDILVELNGKIGSKFIDLAEELESALGSKVDLVSRNGIKSKYLRAIEEDLIYV